LSVYPETLNLKVEIRMQQSELGLFSSFKRRNIS
jgi:hypothetical protein